MNCYRCNANMGGQPTIPVDDNGNEIPCGGCQSRRDCHYLIDCLTPDHVAMLAPLIESWMRQKIVDEFRRESVVMACGVPSEGPEIELPQPEPQEPEPPPNGWHLNGDGVYVQSETAEEWYSDVWHR